MIKDIKNNIIGSEFWLNSEDLSFSEITAISKIPDRWRRFDIIEEEYSDCLIKPVNRYVSNLYPRPELISLNKDTGHVVLRQKTHAEIWVSPKGDDLYALDKTWQRQFYPSRNKYEEEHCFVANYRFYVPWFPDADIDAQICEPPVSPFKVRDQKITFKKIEDVVVFDTEFVDFKIKNVGLHMVNLKYGIIDIATPMYDLKFNATQEQIERLVKQYG
jgi:hypothetical protein